MVNLYKLYFQPNKKVLAKLHYWSLKFILCVQLVPQVWNKYN